ncbi:helix-turn-helix transcriptional regulator [Sanguibacter sp. HDW7]|uniref:helix-turn-helix domain-containing protein n=1 Tax=Sanguibacter sp. HDW7 TaxID=2714931 RepID=UPI00140DB5DE|nr:helix-turn-helix transcriptional regulator [Sanguibacter sp. HDW7]QIK82437.1 helix-turn-helix transcriptional regulator [Sanguibacter sp. HDW7]
MNIRSEEFPAYVGLELKGKIVSRGFTALDVATRIGRSPAAFNRWLNGKVDIPLAVLCAAAEVIDVDPQEIVGHAYDRLVVRHGERTGFIYDADEIEHAKSANDALRAMSPADVMLAARDVDDDAEAEAQTEDA